MPLHDWSKLPDGENVHQLWIVELFRWIKARLPAGYRAGLGTVPALTIGSPPLHPDGNVQHRHEQPAAVESGPSLDPTSDHGVTWQPDVELEVLTLDPSKVVQVTRQGRLIAVVELISPRNKDRREACTLAQSRYLGYLIHGVHLLLVDVHPQPVAFSFADTLAEALGISQPRCPALLAISYRVSDLAPGGGRMLAIGQRPLTVDAPLPAMWLPLTVDRAVPVDLEDTYTKATADAYLT
jgi:hypothetical protein